MWKHSCEREAAVRGMARSAETDPALWDHAARCSVCRETFTVASWMQELAALPVHEGPPADPVYLWWKAELLRRWDIQQRAAAPIEVGERVQVAVGLTGAAILLVWLWREGTRLTTASSNITWWGLADLRQTLAVATIFSAVLLIAIALFVLRDFILKESS